MPPTGPKKSNRALIITLSVVAVVVVAAIIVTVILLQQNNGSQQAASSSAPPPATGSSAQSSAPNQSTAPDWHTVVDHSAAYDVPKSWVVSQLGDPGSQYTVAQYAEGYCPSDKTAVLGYSEVSGSTETDPVKAAQGELKRNFNDNPQFTTDQPQKTPKGDTIIRMHLTEVSHSSCDSTKSIYEVVVSNSSNSSGQGAFLLDIWADQSLPNAPAASDVDKIANSLRPAS